MLSAMVRLTLKPLHGTNICPAGILAVHIPYPSDNPFIWLYNDKCFCLSGCDEKFYSSANCALSFHFF
jgi:hypothetical protein